MGHHRRDWIRKKGLHSSKPARRDNWVIMAGEAPVPTAKQLGIEDLELPRTIISRTMKATFPDGTATEKAAQNAVRRACTVFVSYLGATANDLAKSANKKSIQAQDVFKALDLLEFKGFVEKVEQSFVAHATLVKEKRNAYRKRVAEAGGPLRAKGIATSGGGRGRTGSGTPTRSSSQPHRGSDTGDDEELDEVEDDEDDDMSEGEGGDNSNAGDDGTSHMPPAISPLQPALAQSNSGEATPGTEPRKRKLILKLGPNKALKSGESSPKASPQSSARNNMEVE
ncbi:hypothetical protein SeMB42_g00785 [Synchytrium endobioticum]|uniref:DNA polymerase epsilon subunit D n=1 Tax=Synchytrium endobioticum TaxID=286115 RepID=A0A507DIC3_9FUNG|nr:hypothetical protein SeLEV6574_g00292 [Synchytrium endobioticum]TPX53429.1 hypothetical protein SeMB42_g00785 [Synchytrium endobioticum]